MITALSFGEALLYTKNGKPDTFFLRYEKYGNRSRFCLSNYIHITSAEESVITVSHLSFLNPNLRR